ncbi:MAG TPA: hypothetical protein VKU02_30895 [Gemmataceae bacterium]|nr:hypothetical protein [Gemmataceae bacterium]
MTRSDSRDDSMGAWEHSSPNHVVPTPNRPCSCLDGADDGPECTIPGWDNLWVDLGGEG